MAKTTDKNPVSLPRNSGSGHPEPNPFPLGTSSITAAATLGVPVILCPRRPTHRYPFCWLEDSREHWLVHSFSAIGERREEHAALIRVMQKGRGNGKQMALLVGGNAPAPLETGTVTYSLFLDAGSMARSAQYDRFWQDRAYCYLDQRVPGPATLPDEQLEPLVAANRVFLMAPTEPYDAADPRSIRYYTQRQDPEAFDPARGTPATERKRKRRSAPAPKTKLPKAPREPKPPQAPKPRTAPKAAKPKPAPKARAKKPAAPLRDILDDLLGI